MTDYNISVYHLLMDWAEWMKGYNPSKGYPSRVPILSTGLGSSTFEELLEQVDSQAMKAIDASVDSLPPSNKAAIHRAYGICAIFRHQRENYPYEQALSDAHEMLSITLRRKGVLI